MINKKVAADLVNEIAMMDSFEEIGKTIQYLVVDSIEESKELRSNFKVMLSLSIVLALASNMRKYETARKVSIEASGEIFNILQGAIKITEMVNPSPEDIAEIARSVLNGGYDVTH